MKTNLPTWYRDNWIRQDGVIDAEAKYAFTRGHCHSLALALHKITGWPLVGLFPEFNPYIPTHIVVRSPRGLLDIEGLGADLEWVGRRACNAVDMTEASVARLYAEPDCYLEPEIDVAMPFAQRLLELHFNGESYG